MTDSGVLCRMIYFDVTHAHRCRHHSGLLRVSKRLLTELGEAATAVVWHDQHWYPLSDAAPGLRRLVGIRRKARGRVPVVFTPADWLFTAEVFSPSERPGLAGFLARREVRMAALFHDAIPLKFPDITWPQSVARHAHYMHMLAGFDRVLAVSETSADELRSFWEWQDRVNPPEVSPICLGADFGGTGRSVSPREVPAPLILCTGILEPRKNQQFLMEVCAGLWAEGMTFELHIVGRVNPHFGAPVAAQIDGLRQGGRAIFHHAGLSDQELMALYAKARITAFPTIAEGYGLPLRESIRLGVPCVCSDLPVFRESATGGGCVMVPTNDLVAWRGVLRSLLTDDAQWRKLETEARGRTEFTWSQTAGQVLSALGD